MPELPEVETVCLALSKIITHSRVSNIEIFRKDLRWNIKENLEADLKEEILERPYRRGKYILIPTTKKHILLIHLGMSGTIKIASKGYNIFKHDHIKMIMLRYIFFVSSYFYLPTHSQVYKQYIIFIRRN